MKRILGGLGEKDRQRIGRSRLVTNKTVEKGFHSITFNLKATAKTRYETLEGRQHLVVPMVMITEGVHNGSGGPLYYPKEELSKTPEAWNHKPVVVYHPVANGQSVSACDPDVINSRKIGVIMNTTWDGNRLKAEAWIEVSRAKKIDNRVLEAIEKKEVGEVSTGVFTDNETKSGEWNGEAYTAIARNYRPDHLAILPDQLGACSVADGAGLLRNGEASHEHKRGLLQKALKEKDPNGYGGYLEDMTTDRAIYQDRNGQLVHEGYSIDKKGMKATLKGDPEKLVRKVQYCTADGKAVANSDDWKPIQLTESTGDSVNGTKEDLNVNKAQLIALLCTNSGGLFSESDRTFLETQTAERLQQFADTVKANGIDEMGSGSVEQEGNKTGVSGSGKQKSKKKKINPEEGVTTQAAKTKKADAEDEEDNGDDEDMEDENGKKKTVKNAATVEEYIRLAPAGFRDVLTNMQKSHEATKAALVKQITSNARNKFTAEFLNGKPLEELQALAELAAPVESKKKQNAPMFVGLSEVAAPTANGNAVQNSGEEPLVMPRMDFAKK